MKFYIIIFSFILNSCVFEKNQSSALDISTVHLSGWWVYGEGYHSFMDEVNLNEYDLEFTNEDSLEIIELYMSVVEMEYFPMETNIIGYKENNIVNTTCIYLTVTASLIDWQCFQISDNFSSFRCLLYLCFSICHFISILDGKYYL